MATLRELKGRIGSVASSEKITGAMKMISSAKMHKAEGVLRRLVPFGDCVRTIIASLLSSDAPVSSPLAQPHRSVRKVALVVLGSDDGLCGAYNVNIFKGVLETIADLRNQYGDSIEFEIMPVGKKMAKAFARISSDPALTVTIPEGINSKSEGDAVKNFSQTLENAFLEGTYDLVSLVYMHYHSAGRQRYTAEEYLPVSTSGLAEGNGAGRPCLFEPDAHSIFAAVLPMYLLSRMQAAFAENRASEQAARVMAMQSANDNAKKLLEQLQLEYNKLRQAGITTELLDIVGGQARD
ncbi:MAG: ATP synthase F1 subunit gamma [Muribaculaceae bacterium]|nr:ATP synthase F1 subunit gamma [Muribaculaceae bacterium]